MKSMGDCFGKNKRKTDCRKEKCFASLNSIQGSDLNKKRHKE